MVSFIDGNRKRIYYIFIHIKLYILISVLYNEFLYQNLHVYISATFAMLYNNQL